MNRNQLVILLVLVAVIGGAALLLQRKQQSSWSSGASAGGKLLPELPLNDIARLRIQEGTNSVNLVRGDDRWRVEERAGYPANYSAIRDFLLKARDIKPVQTETVGPSQLPRLQLAPGQGTNGPITIEFIGANEKSLASLLLGKMHLSARRSGAMGAEDGGWPDGRYVRAGTNSDTVALISDPLDQIRPDPSEWLSKEFFRIEKAKSITAQLADTNQSWTLTRETEHENWQLAGAQENEQLNASSVSSLHSPLSSPTFNDVLGATAELPNQRADLVIETFDGFHYELKVGEERDGSYPLLVNVAARFPEERAGSEDETPEDKARLDQEFAERLKKLEDKWRQEQAFGGWTYLVPRWVLDPLLKTRTELTTAGDSDESGMPQSEADHDHAGHSH